MTEAGMPQRLSFPVTPEVNIDSMRDRHILVAEDAWHSGALIIIPREVAQQDKAFIDAIMSSQTVGELRRDARAWAVASERHDQEREDDESGQVPASVDLPETYPYDPESWFGDEGLIYVVPLARLRTAETAPLCLDPLARKDTNYGMDYEPAPWWSVEDLARVEDLLLSHGYEVVEDEELISRYSND